MASEKFPFLRAGSSCNQGRLLTNAVSQTISNIGIIPVIAFNSVDEAIPLCKVLVADGLSAVEVTFRTACAKDCNKKVPDMLLGRHKKRGARLGAP